MDESTKNLISRLYFELPLYSSIDVLGGLDEIQRIYRPRELRCDSYCSICEKQTTFMVGTIHVPGGVPFDKLDTSFRRDIGKAQCLRCENSIIIWFEKRGLNITKIGQTPSLADIANDESKVFSKLLPKSVTADFHRAIGLSAHGIGIGSFIYLRRVFEFIIFNKFSENQKANGWDKDEFDKLRMKEKIEYLKEFIPEFLVTNKKIYGILSKGVHELTEEECLKHFAILKQSILIILEDDKRLSDEAARKEQFTKDIAAIAI